MGQVVSLWPLIAEDHVQCHASPLRTCRGLRPTGHDFVRSISFSMSLPLHTQPSITDAVNYCCTNTHTRARVLITNSTSHYRSRRQSAASNRGDPRSIPGQSMWDLCWTKWHWNTFIHAYFAVPLSVITPPVLQFILIHPRSTPHSFHKYTNNNAHAPATRLDVFPSLAHGTFYPAIKSVWYSR